MIIRWAPGTLAECLGCDVSLIKAWLSGKQGIPAKAGAWIDILATVHQSAERQKPMSLKGKRFKRDKPPDDA
jgi:hypothetical protein